ncbi:MAG: hypothetical protein RIR00_1330 [Pseudomonadota bacterium]|jgi:hypothetical protein
MIKLLHARYRGEFQYLLEFSDTTVGVFEGRRLLERQGPLLDALREESFFARAFIEAGALCWPNGLELSPAKLHSDCRLAAAA